MFSKEFIEGKDSVAEGLRQPYLVIPNALETEKAEALYRELAASAAWDSQDESALSDADLKKQAALTPSYRFKRDYIGLDEPGISGTVRELRDYLRSAGCLQWMTDVSGRNCNGFIGGAARFSPGNHIAEHNDYYVGKDVDGAAYNRTLTFNYYLTKNWQPEWGGSFVWKQPHAEIFPSFNTLVMFLVGPMSSHLVKPVNELATSPRLAISGWFVTRREQNETMKNRLALKR